MNLKCIFLKFRVKWCMFIFAFFWVDNLDFIRFPKKVIAPIMLTITFNTPVKNYTLIISVSVPLSRKRLAVPVCHERITLWFWLIILKLKKHKCLFLCPESPAFDFLIVLLLFMTLRSHLLYLRVQQVLYPERFLNQSPLIFSVFLIMHWIYEDHIRIE